MPGERRHQTQDGKRVVHQPSVEEAISSSDDGITQFGDDELRTGKRTKAKQSTSRDASNGAKRHRTAGGQTGRSIGAKRSSTWSTEQLRTHSSTVHRSMCVSIETHKYGGSDTEVPDRGTLAADDAEARWWSTEPPTMTVEVRIDADWRQGVEGLIQADRLKPIAEHQAACTHSELLGEALTEAEDQWIWSDSDGEQRIELFGD